MKLDQVGKEKEGLIQKIFILEQNRVELREYDAVKDSLSSWQSKVTCLYFLYFMCSNATKEVGPGRGLRRIISRVWRQLFWG